VLAVLVYHSVETYRTAGRILETLKAMEQEEPMQYLETTWTSAGPMTQTVHTTRGQNPDGTDETNEQFVARHQAAVAALKAVYPPI